MTERILLNSNILNEFNKHKSLSIFHKFQRGKNGKNYFFNSNIGIKLFKPEVSWIDPLKNNISFKFNKYENANLLKLLKHTHECLTNIYNAKKEELNEDELCLSHFFYEKDDSFYIRCYLPKIKGKYNIVSCFNNINGQFNIPRKDAVFDYIIIDFRNIWDDKDNLKAGYNIELKETSV